MGFGSFLSFRSSDRRAARGVRIRAIPSSTAMAKPNSSSWGASWWTSWWKTEAEGSHEEQDQDIKLSSLWWEEGAADSVPARFPPAPAPPADYEPGVRFPLPPAPPAPSRRGIISVAAISILIAVMVRKFSNYMIERRGISTLCDDMILEILSKLPIRHMVRLSTVSRNWQTWIRNEQFLWNKTEVLFFPGARGFDFVYLPSGYNRVNNYLYPYQNFPFPRIGRDLFRICYHSSNGLMLLSNDQCHLNLLVHNPLTRQSVEIPTSTGFFFNGPSWIGHDPVSSTFHIVQVSRCHDILALKIFSSRSWTWQYVYINLPLFVPRRRDGRAFTHDGHMFIDLTFMCSVVLVINLDAPEEDCVAVKLPAGLPPCPRSVVDARSVLGMSAGNIRYAFSQGGGDLLVYKLLRNQGGEYQWLLEIEDHSLQLKIVSIENSRHARDFLLHMPFLLISSVDTEGNVFAYSLTDGSVELVLKSDSKLYKIIPVAVSHLEFDSGPCSKTRTLTSAGCSSAMP